MRVGRLMRAVALGAVALVALAGCVRDGNTGYVEIKTVPASARAPSLYIDADKVDALKSGTTVLRQPVGTAKLQVEGESGKLTLCQVVVRKNRITTVTVSSLDRPPRCQCGRSGAGDARTCIG
jgi:hypothetical protein